MTLVLAGRFAVRVPACARDFSLHRNVQTGSGAHSVRPSSYPGVKLPGREVGHSLPSSAFIALTWRTLPVFSLSGKYKVILSIRKIPNQSFRLFHMSCIYLWFIERRVCCLTIQGDSGGKVGILRGSDIGHCEKKEVLMALCLILNSYWDRAADIAPLDFCGVVWIACSHFGHCYPHKETWR